MVALSAGEESETETVNVYASLAKVAFLLVGSCSIQTFSL